MLKTPQRKEGYTKNPIISMQFPQLIYGNNTNEKLKDI